MLRKLSFIITILGIFTLLSLILFLPSKTISSLEQLNNLIDNQKVLVQGKVIKETPYTSFTLITLDNKIELECFCSKSQSLLNKNISALGIVDNFYKKGRIKVLRIKYDN